jgi:hypothetical protein
VLLFVALAAAVSGLAHIARHHRPTDAPTLYEASVSHLEARGTGCVVMFGVYPCYTWPGDRLCMVSVLSSTHLAGLDPHGVWTTRAENNTACIAHMHRDLILAHIHSILFV